MNPGVHRDPESIVNPESSRKNKLLALSGTTLAMWLETLSFLIAYPFSLASQQAALAYVHPWWANMSG